jgi:RNA polymerase sigma factor (sigma-70 family)
LDAARLFDEHHGALFRYLVRLTGDPDVAADAAQEAFARLIAKPPRDEKPRAWLFTVATNLVRAWANSGKRRRALLDGSRDRAPSADAPLDPASAAHRSEVQRAVRHALDSLNEKERTVLLMREEGFSHREIANCRRYYNRFRGHDDRPCARQAFCETPARCGGPLT